MLCVKCIQAVNLRYKVQRPGGKLWRREVGMRRGGRKGVEILQTVHSYGGPSDHVVDSQFNW